MLIFFIYAVVGVQLFAKVGNYENAAALSIHSNFLSVPSAIVTLLRMSTGEAWPDMMYDLSNKFEGCEIDPEYDATKCGFAGDPWQVNIFF